MMRNVWRIVLAFMMVLLVIGCDDQSMKFEFSFHENGGSQVNGYWILRRDWDGELPVSTREGYAFGGWYLDSELTIPANQDTVQQYAISLYAKWIPSEIVVIVEYWLEGLDGVFVLDFTENIGGITDQTVQANPRILEGFSEMRDHPDRIGSGIPTGNDQLHLRLYYHRMTFPLVYVFGMGFPNQNFEVLFGDSIALITEGLDHASYTFLGWYKDPSCYFEPMTDSTMRGGPLILYAKWSPKTVTVTFETYEGSPISPLSGPAYTTMHVPFTNRSGYHLFGWYIDPEFTTRYTEMTTFPGSNLTLYAKWIGDDCLVTIHHWFENVSGGYSLFYTIYEEGQIDRFTYTTPRESEGWVFTNQHPDQVLSGWPRVDQPLTLNLYYDLRSYPIHFVSNCNLDLPDIDVKRGHLIRDYVTYPTCEGYIRDNWYLDPDFTIFAPQVMPESELTFYMRWYPNSYSVDFETNGGTAIPSVFVEYQTSYVLPEASAIGYDFVGWYLDEELTIPLAMVEAMPAHDVTVYAKWTPAPITVSFVTNGGPTVEPIVVWYQSSYALPSPEYEGHLFGGWYWDAEFTASYVNTGAMTSPNDVTLYARWYGMTYYVHFDTMGGSYLPGLSLASGADLTLPIPTREGFEFLGWYDASLTNLFTATIMPEENLQLYAKWRPL